MLTKHPPPEETEAPSLAVEIISSPGISDINVEFSGYKQRNKFLTFYICYDLPEEEEWSPNDAFLKIGNKEIPLAFVVLDTDDDGLNCPGIMFSTDAIRSPGKAELSIKQLITFSAREVRNCDKVQRKLDEAKTGIVIACNADGSGVVSGFEILEKPQDMSEDEARKRVDNEFLSVIQVDWKFMFLIKKL